MTKKQKVFDLLLSLVLIMSAVFLLVLSATVRTGVKEGLISCGNILIPSLFPFMVLSGLLSKSRARLFVERIFSPVMHRLFYLPPAAAGAVFMGFIGGYPVGAQYIAGLLEQKSIDKATAARMLCFCVNAGPPFLITALGSVLFGNAESGVLLLICQWASAICIGMVAGIAARKDKNKSLPTANFTDPLPFSHALVESVAGGIMGMLTICGYVLVFSAVISIFFHIFSSGGPLLYFVAGMLEVTTGCIGLSGVKDLVSIGFLVSFSGLSVICQVCSFFKGAKINLVPFLCSRAVHGGLTALFVKLCLVLFPQANAVFSNFTGGAAPALPASPLVSALLMILCAVFLLSISKKAKNKPD